MLKLVNKTILYTIVYQIQLFKVSKCGIQKALLENEWTVCTFDQSAIAKKMEPNYNARVRVYRFMYISVHLCVCD